MKKPIQHLIIFASLILLTCCSSAIAQTDSRIAGIRRLHQKVEEQIALSEQAPDSSTTFLSELVVNKNESPYPAVGIYRSVIKFYYTFGDRERSPYPDRLLKVMVSTNRSDRKESSEYLFNEAGQLVFFSEKTEDVHHSLFLARERPIGFQEAGNFVNLKSKRLAVSLAQTLKNKAKLVEIFRGSLQF